MNKTRWQISIWFENGTWMTTLISGLAPGGTILPGLGHHSADSKQVRESCLQVRHVPPMIYSYNHPWQCYFSWMLVLECSVKNNLIPVMFNTGLLMGCHKKRRTTFCGKPVCVAHVQGPKGAKTETQKGFCLGPFGISEAQKWSLRIQRNLTNRYFQKVEQKKTHRFPWFHGRLGPLLINGKHQDASVLSPGGQFPPSFIHQVIIITGLNKLYNCNVLALKMALDADRA